jgi:hypothetical protein
MALLIEPVEQSEASFMAGSAPFSLLFEPCTLHH